MSDFVIVVEDLAIVGLLLMLALLFGTDLSNWRFRMVSIGFLLASGSFIFLAIGDVAIMVGYEARDLWFLTREWRAHPWRLGLIISLGLLGFLLRFSSWFYGRR